MLTIRQNYHVMEVKQPTKNIPPPPSARLPPPPPNKSKTPSHCQGPPPVKKVLPGPPPVKHVLGKHQTVKKALSSPVPPPIVQQDSNSNEDMTIKETASKITQKVETIPPVITHELDKPPPDSIPKNDVLNPVIDDSNSLQQLFIQSDKLENMSEPAVRPKPAIRPKPNIKLPTSPKPRKHLATEENKKGIQNISMAEQSNVKQLCPIPPEKTRSLPNAPNVTLCPLPLPRRNLNSVNAEHHILERKTRNPSRPSPPLSPSSSLTTQSETAATEDTNKWLTPPVSPRRRSNTLPAPTPAPRKTTRIVTSESSLLLPPEEPRVRTNSLISSMKTIEVRSARQIVQTTERSEIKSSETIKDDKPVPKQLRKCQNTVVINRNAPPRPPPPSIRRETPQTQNIEKPGIIPIQQHPVPKPRSVKNKDSDRQSVAL